MSTLFGIINKTQQPVSEEELTAIANNLSYWLPDSKELLAFENVGMGILNLHTSKKKESPENLYRKNDFCIVSDARIDNTEELCQKLSLRKKNNRPSLILLEAYKKWGQKCVEHLLGDFAFAIYDEKEKILFLARDQIGVKPLFYFNNKKYFVFGSDLKSIKSFQLADHPLDELFIGETLVHLIADKERTCYQNILQLTPGHTLTIHEGKAIKQKYWDMNPKQMICFKNEDDYIDGLREKLDIAVKRRIKDVDNPGCELSGGIDSSAVFAFAHERNPNILALSHVMDEEDKEQLFPYKDERYFIDLLLKHRQTNNIAYVTSKNEDLPGNLKKYSYIFDGFTQSAFHLLSNPLYKSASGHGINVLLSGFGGDELVSSKAHGFLNELATTKQWKKLYDKLQDQHSGMQAKSMFVKKILKSFLPVDVIKDKMEVLLNNEFKRFPVSKKFAWDTGLYKHYLNKKKIPTDPILSEKQYLKIMHAHVPQRLTNCAIAAKSRKIEYRYPLLDIELMAFYLALPPEIKQKEGTIRYPIRKVIEGYVPSEIQWRTDKSFHTIPTFYAYYHHNYDAIARLINDSGKSPASRYINIPALKTWSEELLDRSENSRYTFKGIYSYLWFLQYISNL